jgi:hypothetical protein
MACQCCKNGLNARYFYDVVRFVLWVWLSQKSGKGNEKIISVNGFSVDVASAASGGGTNH